MRLYVLSTIFLIPGLGQAAFIKLDMSGVKNSSFTDPGYRNAGFPTGDVVLGGVPFDLGPPAGPNAWNAEFATGSNPRTLTLNPLISNVDIVYVLMNTWWGQPGPSSYANISFAGTGGATYSVDLIGGVHIRDFNQAEFTNFTTSPDTTEVFQSMGGARRLDMLRFDLPASFLGQMLTGITVSDNGGTQFQRAFVSGMTAQTITPAAIPEPATILLTAAGLLAVTLRRRLHHASR
jgi:hypothetical protein